MKKSAFHTKGVQFGNAGEYPCLHHYLFPYSFLVLPMTPLFSSFGCFESDSIIYVISVPIRVSFVY